MVKTHETIADLGSKEQAEEYIRDNFDVEGEPLDKYAVSVPNRGHSSPALSFRVSDEEIRYAHALSTGHAIIRYDRDTGRGSGPNSDQKKRTQDRDPR